MALGEHTFSKMLSEKLGRGSTSLLSAIPPQAWRILQRKI